MIGGDWPEGGGGGGAKASMKISRVVGGGLKGSIGPKNPVCGYRLVAAFVPSSRLTSALWFVEASHRPLSSSLLGLPYRVLKMNHKKELLRGLWVAMSKEGGFTDWLGFKGQSSGNALYAGCFLDECEPP